VRFQKLMWRNIMRSIKSQKASVLHYNINRLGYHFNNECEYKFIDSVIISIAKQYSFL
jgi:hypothetical protein